MPRFFFYITLFLLIIFTGFKVHARGTHVSGRMFTPPHNVPRMPKPSYHVSGSPFVRKPVIKAPKFAPNTGKMAPFNIPNLKLPNIKKPTIRHNKAARPTYQGYFSPKEAAERRRDRIKDGWRSFTRRNTKHWVVVWNLRTGLPYKILGNKTHAFSGNVEEVGIEFINENQDLFLLGDASSNLTMKEKSDNGDKSVVTFSQTYNDIPVLNSEINIYISNADSKKTKHVVRQPRGRMSQKQKEPPAKEKNVYKVVCTLYPLQADEIGKEKIGKTQASDVASKDFEREHKKTKATKIERVIYPTKGRVYRAWRVLFMEEKVGYSFLVDADKGEVLLRDIIK